jgi:hypothetical protein
MPRPGDATRPYAELLAEFAEELAVSAVRARELALHDCGRSLDRSAVSIKQTASKLGHDTGEDQ